MRTIWAKKPFQQLESTSEENVVPHILKKDSNLDFQCQCKELLDSSSEKTSLCSDYSNSRGDSQKVISVSYYSTK